MTRLNGKPVRILQITDCHLGQSSDEALLGLKTADTLNSVLGGVKANEARFDLVLNTGDISNDGTVASYDRFINAVRSYIPGTPLAWLEGNHDDPGSMRHIISSPPQTDFVSIGDWNLILLNSRVPFEERGELPQSELDRLSDLLAAAPDVPTMIFLHHQLVPVGSAWIDQYVVSNAEAFFKVTDAYKNIKVMSWGHVHQEFHMNRHGVDLLATPSTCLQFKPQNDDFTVDDAMPGYRVYELFDNGVYQTKVVRVEARTQGLDMKSGGY